MSVVFEMRAPFGFFLIRVPYYIGDPKRDHNLENYLCDGPIYETRCRAVTWVAGLAFRCCIGKQGSALPLFTLPPPSPPVPDCRIPAGVFLQTAKHRDVLSSLEDGEGGARALQ